MKAWLKYFFLGFFSDKYTEQAPERSFWNTVLAVFLAFIILATGYFVGFVASFGTHYDNATEFRRVVGEAIESVGLRMEGGRLSADGTINDFEGLKEGEKLEGYGVILDTRPAATTYDDFSVVCSNSDGNEISYGEYLKLSENDKKNYSAQLLFSGKWLDVTLKQDEYKSVLSETESGRATLANLDKDLADGNITDKEYCDRVYVEYVKAYYPPMSQVERYGDAPTLRTYYLGMAVSGFSDRFVIILDDLCVGAFESDKNIGVQFEGYYSGIAEGAITDADAFIKSAFAAGSGYNFLLNLFNMFKLAPVILIAMLVLALLVFIVCRYKVSAYKTGYIGSLKIVGSFVLITTLLSFLIAIALSFFNAKSTVYFTTIIAFIVILALRTAALLIVGSLKERREQKEIEANSNN